MGHPVLRKYITIHNMTEYVPPSLMRTRCELLSDLEDAVVELDDDLAGVVVEVDARLQEVQQEEPRHVRVDFALGEGVSVAHHFGQRLQNKVMK